MAVALLSIIIIVLSDSLASSNSTPIRWFPEIDPAMLSASPNTDFMANLTAYQQTTDYNCGPAALLSLASFYGLPGIGKIG